MVQLQKKDGVFLELDFWFLKPTLDVFDSWPLQIKNIQTERYVSNIYNDWKTVKGVKIIIPSV